MLWSGKPHVAGSSPVGTTRGAVAQMAEQLQTCLVYSPVAQWQERAAVNRQCVGSTPTRGASLGFRTMAVRPALNRGMVVRIRQSQQKHKRDYVLLYKYSKRGSVSIQKA